MSRPRAALAAVPILLVETADTPAALFGDDPSLWEARLRELRKAVHPDRFPDPALKARAEKAFQRLQELHTQLTGRAARMGDWVIEKGLCRGDIADLYTASPAPGRPGGPAVLKLARSVRDNDLIRAEAEALTLLASPLAGKEAAAVEKALPYLPALVGTITVSGRSGNILTHEKNFIPLARFGEIWKSGIDFRHVVWMLNRALTVLGYAHHRGLIHGAVLPEHLLYDVTTHRIKLIDWCYSVPADGTRPISAIAAGRRAFYPAEVIRKKAPVPATDLYLLMRSMGTAPVDGTWPEAMENVRMWALAASPNSRPQSAWDLQERWAAAARRTFGPRQFLELRMPQ